MSQSSLQLDRTPTLKNGNVLIFNGLSGIFRCVRVLFLTNRAKRMNVAGKIYYKISVCRSPLRSSRSRSFRPSTCSFRFVKIWLGGGPAALLPGTAAKVAKKKRPNGVGGQFFSVKFFQKPSQKQCRGGVVNRKSQLPRFPHHHHHRRCRIALRLVFF